MLQRVCDCRLSTVETDETDELVKTFVALNALVDKGNQTECCRDMRFVVGLWAGDKHDEDDELEWTKDTSGG